MVPRPLDITVIAATHWHQGRCSAAAAYVAKYILLLTTLRPKGIVQAFAKSGSDAGWRQRLRPAFVSARRRELAARAPIHREQAHCSGIATLDDANAHAPARPAL